MALGHFVRLKSGIFDTSEVLHEERSLVVKKLVFVLLIGQ